MDNQQLQIPSEVRSFLEGLLQDAGMASLDDQMHEEMIKELYARLDNFITASIVDNMSEDKIEEFIKLNEQQRPREEIEKYIQENMPNAQEVFTKAFSDFRALYLGGVTVDRNVAVQKSSQPNDDISPAPVETQDKPEQLPN